MSHFVNGQRLRRKYPPNSQPCKAERLGLRLRTWIDSNRWLPKKYIEKGE